MIVMAKKLRVGVLFGGRSGEHEVSLLSAASILKAIDRKKFDVVPIGITKEGRWLGAADAHGLLEGDQAVKARDLRAGDPDATPGARLLQEGMPTLMAPQPAAASTGELKRRLADKSSALDVVFPVLHGTFGEDGTIQGLFELAGIAYVGSGVLGSSAGMDKDVMKRLFAQAGLPIEARDGAAFSMGGLAAQDDCADRNSPEIPAVRKTGKPRLVRWHQQGT